MLILLFEGIQVEVNDYFQSQLLQLAEHSRPIKWSLSILLDRSPLRLFGLYLVCH